MSRPRVAIVVQRCHPSVTGGSETLAWQYATLLRESCRVEILTSTTVDAVRWRNDLPEGVTDEDGVKIRRFSVSQERSDYWHALHERLQADALRNVGPGRLLDHRRDWTLALQCEFILKQGPDCPTLLAYLDREAANYDGLVFVTYLYPTTYFGRLAAGNHAKTYLVPTLHLEPPAYLSAFASMARRFRALLWNAEAERQLCTELWGELPGDVVSMAVDCKLAEREATSPYLLYSGRIDPHKGCREMLDYFMKMKGQYPSALKLYLTGTLAMELPDHPEIHFLGFVSPGEKKKLMRNAIAFIMPSAMESLSIVTLEAMAQETPVLANSNSAVVATHVIESGGGALFQSQESFLKAVQQILQNDGTRERMGVKARAYVENGYESEAVRGRLLRRLELDLAGAANAARPELSQAGLV